jgi:preprotein translocase subunit YajC
VLFALFWLLLIRPQRRRQLAQSRLLDELEVGDEVVSTGGLFGVIREINGTELHVEVADGVVVRMTRRAVAGLVERDEPEAEPEPEAESEPAAEPETPAEPS